MTRAIRSFASARGAFVLTVLMAAAGQAGAVCNNAGAPCPQTSGAATQSNLGAINAGAVNPIHVVSGNKYQQEVDLPALPAERDLPQKEYEYSKITKIGTATRQFHA